MGLALGRYFLERDEDCRVVLGVRSRRDKAETLVSEFGERAHLVTLDVTQESDWERAMSEIAEKFGAVTVLVNNAGYHEDGLMATMTNEAWDGVMEANLRGSFLGSRAVMNGMIGERFGRIVNVASLSALMAPMGQTNYAAAKAGVVAMSQSLAKEVARMGITVNSVCPGYIETEALKEMSKEEQKGRKMAIPMRRFGKVEEVAAAVFFLASREAAYITGSTLKIDGGIF